MEILLLFILLIIFGFGYFIYYIIKKTTPDLKQSSSVVNLEPVEDLNSFNPFAIIIDVETTGLIKDNSIRVTKNNVVEFEENFPGIVQLSFMLIDKDGKYDGQSFYIKQEKEIPKQAIKIHGITTEKCNKEGVDKEKAFSELTIAASKVDTIAGHNVSFDYKVLNAEFAKSKIPFPLKKKNKVDTMKLTGKHLGHKYGFKISLYNAAEKLFGNKPEWKSLKPQLKQHNAESDVIVTALIFNMLYKE